ncbi:MAG: YgaP family membrane protein [Sulfuricaulis sp.]
MLYVKNLPWWERSLRISAGTIAAAYALLGVGGVIGSVILAGGIGMALTGIFGFCPACALAGRRLEKRLQPEQKLTGQ